MINCNQAEDLAPFYIAGALRITEAAELETHLTSCRLHDETLDELRSTAFRPGAEVEDLALPSSLKTRIMTAVREEARDEQQSRIQPQRAPRLKPATVLAGALAVAVLALAGMFAWNLHLRSASPDQNEAFAGRMLGDGGATGAFFYSEAVEGVVMVSGLTPLPSDKTYQVWARTGDSTVSCGLLALAQTGPSYARMTAEMKPGARIFVTVEPAGGSTTPTGAPVLSSP